MAGWRCCWVLVAEDIQPLNVAAVPRVMRPDFLGNQGAQCVDREVVGLCFVRRGGCAEGMWSFTVGHPEERYGSWDDRVTVWECGRLGAVRCGWCCAGSLPMVAMCPCVRFFAGLRVLVMDEEVVIHAAVLGGLLCFLCVHLDAVLQLCVRTPDGGELHVTYRCFRIWGVVGDDPVELDWHRSPEHRFFDLRLPHQAPELICCWRGRAPPGVLCYGVLRCPLDQVVASLGQQALFEGFQRLRLLEMAGAYGIFRGYVYTPPAIPACHPV